MYVYNQATSSAPADTALVVVAVLDTKTCVHTGVGALCRYR
jgi:hypothetical protein